MNDDYYIWMIQAIAHPTRMSSRSYAKLFQHLHNMPFVYTHPLDENRYLDGINLRYRYAYENDIPKSLVDSELDSGFCSVLEMMVALALRCEDIMSNTMYGDRTYLWFFTMLDNMGIGKMIDKRYRPNIVEARVVVALSRCYEPNGLGGWFYLEHRNDMNELDIWYQAMHYLTYISKEE